MVAVPLGTSLGQYAYVSYFLCFVSECGVVGASGGRKWVISREI